MGTSTNETFFNIKESNFYQETFESNGNDYILKETEIAQKDEKFKSNFLDKNALRFFKNLGGKESIKQGEKFGLGCTINISISPDRETKKITYFFY